MTLYIQYISKGSQHDQQQVTKLKEHLLEPHANMCVWKMKWSLIIAVNNNLNVKHYDKYIQAFQSVDHFLRCVYIMRCLLMLFVLQEARVDQNSAQHQSIKGARRCSFLP